MSNTHKHKNKGRVNRFRKVRDFKRDRIVDRLVKEGWGHMPAFHITWMAIPDPWDEMTYEQQQAIYNYKNPGWFNHMQTIEPRRRDDRDKLKQITLYDEGDQIFENDKKPCDYFY